MLFQSETTFTHTRWKSNKINGLQTDSLNLPSPLKAGYALSWAAGSSEAHSFDAARAGAAQATAGDLSQAGSIRRCQRRAPLPPRIFQGVPNIYKNVFGEKVEDLRQMGTGLLIFGIRVPAGCPAGSLA
ncbi:hypothetical protein [Bosea sp. BIWAKO-01]|uniref:hypothetical protein n=1 Tax=Bosea sp. BIWAKO-01 TaxID=506668 RepID=UPI0008533370|nr:hypothetical protein [Bosea sp. BIWAKO-01]